MDREQELEWLEAQKIVVSEDLVAAAKKQLQFLSTIDRHRCLYDGPVLHRAIFRYKTYWLPLLAKHTKSENSKGPLVVPLDCEWIWHCHRLNPLRYKADCEEFYGCILDNKNVLSTTQGASKRQTEEIWNRLYPEESYELDLNTTPDNLLGASEGIKYNLVAAVKRQSPFFYQVSRPVMNDDLFLQEAAARYKGFLHMIKRNKERSIRRFCVPTYEIDLIWHSHQLHPVSYGKDLVEALGKVLEHDDTDSDRTKGQKLDVGFSGTTLQWEETFGTRYWRAGGMYRGAAPSPLMDIPSLTNIPSKTVVPSSDSQIRLQLSKTTVIEVLLEIVGVKNLPEAHKGSVFVFFSKKTRDAFLDGRRRLCISSESRQKQVASIQCEPTGELFLELISHPPSSLGISKPAKTLGTTSISLQNMLDPISKLSNEKWFEMVPYFGTLDSNPISLRIAISITTPAPAPYVLHMVRSRPIFQNTRVFQLPGRIKHAKGWTCVVDKAGSEIINIQMRNLKKAVSGNDNPKSELVGIVGRSGETHVVAKFSETVWSVMDSSWFSQVQKKSSKDGYIFELSGNRLVQLFPGKKLKYEPKSCQRQKNDSDFVTAVEFSNEDPYGKEVALFNLKSGVLKIEEEWFVLSGIALAFIVSDFLRKEGNNVLVTNGENSDKVVKGKTEKGRAGVLKERGNIVMSGGCSGSCGSGCGNLVMSGGCSGSCGSGCGNLVMSGGCSGNCGSGCGNLVMSGGCSGSCGSGCGNMVMSGGCSSSCGSGCGNMVMSGGCSGNCGGDCGNMVTSGAGTMVERGGGSCGNSTPVGATE